MKSSFIKRLYVSVCAALAATSAQAVYLSTTGTGQVLIYPYYTARNGFATLLSVTNTQNNTKALKIRFREGMNGRDVSNFSLFLAPNDTWTAVVTDTASGARILTNDNSCVGPSFFFDETHKFSGTTQTFNEFYNFFYTGPREDNPAFASMDRTREGYFEIIEMGVIDAALSTTAAQIVGYVKPDSSTTNCAAVDGFDPLASGTNPIRFPNSGAALTAPPRGGLRGFASLVNAASGANYTYRPTALDGWSSQVAYSELGGRGTLLSDAFPAASVVSTPDGVVTARWANGRDAVSAVLMRESLMNDFVLDNGTASQTDWIVTLPTKPFHTDSFYTIANSTGAAPFGGYMSSADTTISDGLVTSLSNRDGNRPGSFIFPSVRPPPPTGSGSPQLCRTTNVVPFSATATGGVFNLTSLLGSPTLSPVGYYDFYLYIPESASSPSPLTSPALRGGSGPNGRATFLFNQAQQQLTPLSATLISPSGTQTTIPGKHFGLPVIGLMLHNYKNANVVSRYGGVIEHSYAVRVE